ncbi:MAG: sigma-70 family RNA polymerase sigma factor [Candidatus Zixiibacteriota bacterium]
MTNELALIESILQGDQRAFNELVSAYQNRIFGFIMRMTANREAAKDLTQDTFLAAYQNLSRFRQDASFSTWLFQIAANKTKNFIKRAKREVPLPVDFDQASDTNQPDDEYSRKQQEELLLGAVGALPTKQRIAFNLRYFEHMKFDEIARVQSVSVSAAKTNFAEALKKLKKALGE